MIHAEMKAHLLAAPPGAAVRAALAAVLLHVGPELEPCTASQSKIAALAGISLRQTRYALRELVEAGTLESMIVIGVGVSYGVPLQPVADLPLQPVAAVEPLQPVAGVAPTPATRCSRPLQPVADKGESRGEGPLLGSFLDGRQELPGLARTPARASARARNAPPNAELYAALCSAAGFDIQTMTPSQRARTGKAAKGLAGVGATPDEIAGQALAMEMAWGNPPAPWTVEANWNRTLNGKPRPSRRTSAADNWRATDAQH